MGEESEGTGKTKSPGTGQRASLTATFEGQINPQAREKLIAGVKKLAKECGVEVSIG